MAKISQVRQDVNALLGYAASNQTAFAAAKVFINGRVDLASPNEVTKFIRENVIEAQEFVKGHLSKSATKDVEPKTAPVDAVLPIEAHETTIDTAQQDLASVQAQTLTNSRATPTKSTNKMKDKAIRGVEAQLIHIRDRDNKRKAVWLEPVFYEALARVTADKNQSQWLTDILVNVGEGNLASAVRCSIVKELLA